MIKWEHSVFALPFALCGAMLAAPGAVELPAGPVRLVGILCIAAMIVGGWASWTTLREPEAKPTLRLIAFVSIGMAALGIFALLLPLIASLILPPCFE